jgi:hypothetical protein
MNSNNRTWVIGQPETGGFKGVKLGVSNNDLQPGESSNMFNYFANDQGLTKREGFLSDNEVELFSAGVGITGLFRFYDGASYRTFAKCGTKVYDLNSSVFSPFLLTSVVEAGDASNQLSNWILVGGSDLNVDIHWQLTNSSTTRTVDIYYGSTVNPVFLMATGSRTGDGTITLDAVGTWGLSGSVSVVYTGDDTDLANNTLTFPSLTAADEIEFVSWWGKYFFTDGTDIYFGTTGGATLLSLLDENGVAISGVHPHGKTPVVHQERMWLTRDPNYPTRVYFSMGDYYDRFHTNGGVDVASWVSCDRDDGQAITGMIRYNGRLFVTKRHKTYWIIGEPSDVFPFSGTLQVISGPPSGAYDQKTLVDCPDGFLRWFGPDGVWQYSDSTGAVNISANIYDELKDISETNKAKCAVGWFGHYFVLTYPNTDNGTYNDRTMVFDTYRGQWYPMDGLIMSRMIRYEDNTLHAGSSSEGHVYTMFTGNTDNDVDISCYFKTRMECNIPGFEQCLRSIQIMNLKDGQSVTIRWNANQDSPASGSVTDTFSFIGTYLGEFQLGDEDIPDDGDLLVSEDELDTSSTSPLHRVDNTNRFRSIYFEIEETGPTPHSFDYLEIKSTITREVL